MDRRIPGVTDLVDRRMRTAARLRARAGEERRMRDDDLALTRALAAAIDGPALSLALIDGSTVTGVVVRACHDGVMLAVDDRRWIVGLGSIVFMRHAEPTRGSSAPCEELELAVLLEACLEFGAGVHVRMIAHTITGSVRSIGSDVLVLRANDGSEIHVAIDRIVAVGFDASDGPAMRQDARNDSTSERINRMTRPNR